MKKTLTRTLILSFFISLNSCMVINSLLGINQCNYPNCDRECAPNCNYCSFHCDSYNVPDDLTFKTGQSINKQLEQYRNDQKKK